MTLANNQFIRIRKGYHGTYFQLVEYAVADGASELIGQIMIERKRLTARDRKVRVYVANGTVERLWAEASRRRTRNGVAELVQVAFEMNGGKGEAEGRVMRPF